MNGAYSLDFSREDLAIIGASFHTFIYDFNTNKAENILHFDDSLMKYGWQVSQTANPEGGILVSAGNTIYLTQADNFSAFAVDSTFIFNDYLNVVRFWNGHFWAAGLQNVYKNEDIAKANEVPCAKIETIWPNPFTDQFSILFKVEVGHSIHFQCFNALGQMLENFDTYYDMGLYERSVNLSDQSRGIYFYRITSGCGSETYKMMRE
jgi:hypothetical protein